MERVTFGAMEILRKEKVDLPSTSTEQRPCSRSPIASSLLNNRSECYHDHPHCQSTEGFDNHVEPSPPGFRDSLTERLETTQILSRFSGSTNSFSRPADRSKDRETTLGWKRSLLLSLSNEGNSLFLMMRQDGRWKRRVRTTLLNHPRNRQAVFQEKSRQSHTHPKRPKVCRRS